MTIRFALNGRDVEVSGVSPNTTLLNYLRGPLGLTGTKEGCAEGDCGACTVAIADVGPNGPVFRAENACLVLLPMVHGKSVTTVEGLKTSGAPHPVQTAMVDRLGSQCGYCTPGFVMSLFEAAYRRDLDEPWKLDDQIAGNLCRCTGYRPIREALVDTAGRSSADRFASALAKTTAEPAPLAYADGGLRFDAPATEAELFAILDRHPEARLVAGGTDLALEITKRFRTLPHLVSLGEIPSLRAIELGAHVRIGAGARLSDLEAAARPALPALERMLRFFGARQIKHRATVGGNLANASPIGDLAPILIAYGAEIELASSRGRRTLPLEDFFVGYRKTVLEPGEIVRAVRFEAPAAATRIAAYKVSKRQELDISAVSAGLLVRLDPSGAIAEARFAYGGMAERPKRASHAERAVLGRRLDPSALDAARQALEEDFTPIDDHRGSAWYRRTVAQNLLTGFWHETASDPSPRLPHRPVGTVVLEETP